MTGTDTKIGWAELALRKGGVAVYEAGAVEQVVDAIYAAGLDHHVERAHDGAGLECWIVRATPAPSPTVELDADLIEAHGEAA